MMPDTWDFFYGPFDPWSTWQGFYQGFALFLLLWALTHVFQFRRMSPGSKGGDEE